jgi:hypothetical protein
MSKMKGKEQKNNKYTRKIAYTKKIKRKYDKV